MGVEGVAADVEVLAEPGPPLSLADQQLAELLASGVLFFLLCGRVAEHDEDELAPDRLGVTERVEKNPLARRRGQGGEQEYDGDQQHTGGHSFSLPRSA